MVVIRLARVGKKNHPTFRIIVSDKRKDTRGPYLELLGTYDPHRTPTHIDVNEERVKHWLSVGAKPSDTVHNLLVDKGLVAGSKVTVGRPKAAPAAATPAAPAGTPVENQAAPAV